MLMGQTKNMKKASASANSGQRAKRRRDLRWLLPRMALEQEGFDLNLMRKTREIRYEYGT
jgi:hypothetical protein